MRNSVLAKRVSEMQQSAPDAAPLLARTNLANRAQPLICYDLGDPVTVLTVCECGSALPAIRVEGRHDDVLRIADRRGQMAVLLPLVLTTVIEKTRGCTTFS